MNLRFLETFVWVARLRSFSLTADKLNTTQAAVSHRIATLEQELGVRLFERGTREVRLTAQGLSALDHAERIVRLAADFRQRMSDPKALAGTVRIGVIDTIAYSWLPELIGRVSNVYPGVVLELNAANSIDIARDLRTNLVDLGLLMGPVEGKGIVNVDLCTFACAWVASPKLGVPRGNIDLAELAQFPVLSFPRDSKPHQDMLRLFDRAGVSARPHTGALSTIIRLAIDGIGVAAIPVPTIQREIADNRLEVLDVSQPFPPLALHAAYLETEDRPLPALIAAMARQVAEGFCRTQNPGIAW